MAIRDGGNTKLMALLAQQGLLFHCSNRLSRTNCCLEPALMFAENHIIIQRNELLWTAAWVYLCIFFCIFLKYVFIFCKVLHNHHKLMKKPSKQLVVLRWQNWLNFTSLTVAEILIPHTIQTQFIEQFSDQPPLWLWFLLNFGILK